MLFEITTLLISAAYAWLNIKYLYYWYLQKKRPILSKTPAKVQVAVLVVGRNESENLPFLLESLAVQTYPANSYELVFVDDHSEDESLGILRTFAAQNRFKTQILELKNAPLRYNPQSYKKNALSYALEHTQAELILCTDADCVVPKSWISEVVAVYTNQNARAVCAPVLFSEHPTDGLLQRFQQLDLLGMMVVTQAGVFLKEHLANGANLAYPKAVFEEVGGYAGADQHASGDDMLLLHKIARIYPENIHFLQSKHAAVETPPVDTWAKLWQQRLRWASKSKSYTQTRLQLSLATVWGFCALLLANLGLGLLVSSDFLLLFVGQILLKVVLDFCLLCTAAHFFDRKHWLWYFPCCFGMHILYVFGVGLLANLIKKYEWKGRKTE
jgi:cellulose synthase/poly-beta-1,6-N-acetylglucosamine synthase-like glycosyltransferase